MPSLARILQMARVNPTRPLDEQPLEVLQQACTPCGRALHLHWNTDGIGWIGCDGAASRLAIGETNQDARGISMWGDQHPDISLALIQGLATACGTAVQELFWALSFDERTILSRKLADIAVRTYLRTEGRAS